jgi:hypothetical protein
MPVRFEQTRIRVEGHARSSVADGTASDACDADAGPGSVARTDPAVGVLDVTLDRMHADRRRSPQGRRRRQHSSRSSTRARCLGSRFMWTGSSLGRVATLELLEKLGVEVDYPFDQTCCGQPMATSGAFKQARRRRSCLCATSRVTSTSSRRGPSFRTRWRCT